MKVVHISTTDYGGAYKAAARISESMNICGIDSEVLIRTKKYRETVGIEIFTNLFQKIYSKAKNLLNLLMSRREVISDYIGTDITEHPLVKEADVVILHWVNSFVSYGIVEKLQKLDKPVLWVMHDMWLFTGGCHVDQYCGGYEHQCGNCPLIRSKRQNDVSRKNFLRKIKMFNQSEIVLVGPSSWILSEASKSKITCNLRMLRIPNPINTEIYRPISNSKELKSKYGISEGKKIILYGAVNATGDRNKGYYYLLEALKRIDRNKYTVVIFGNKDRDSIVEEIVDTVFMGYIQDEQTLIELYNLADVFVAPSQQENYPNSVLEASACGTPVVAFRIGGIPDIVSHKGSGYLAPYCDIEELAAGIRFCAGQKEKMGMSARQKVVETNSYELIGNKYKELIQNMIEQE